MKPSFRRFPLVVTVACSLISLPGCGGGPSQPPADAHADHDHEHEEMPETFAAAVEELKKHAPEIKEAFEAGKPEDVHDALHYLGEMSTVMEDLIDASSLSPEQKTEAKAASESLFDQYMRLDTEVLHGSEGDVELKYEDVASSIDEALAKLEALVPAGEEQEHEDHPVEEQP